MQVGASIIIGFAGVIGFAICSIGALRGNKDNRPTAVVAAALFLIAAAIAFK